MIRSIRYFLLISLLISITIASAITAVGNYLLDEHVVQPSLDNQLIKIASLIDILSQSALKNNTVRNTIINDIKKTMGNPSQHFLFQVWDKKGNLLLHSTRQFPQLKNSAEGLSDQTLDKDDWRIYTMFDKDIGIKIVVGESYLTRSELADDIARNNAYTLLITYPIFGLLVWLIITLALRSITRVTSEISNRASTFLAPVKMKKIPVEIEPLVSELNKLFIRLKLAFERNKRFSADAAHELRTPLAALKTQTQVALKAENIDERNSALLKVVQSVDRCSHVVAQLLTLSRLGEERGLTDIKPVELHKLAAEIVAYLVPQALDKNIEVELSSQNEEEILLGNDAALGILIRNVVDNAIRYTPPGGIVKVAILNTDHHITFRVTDNGPGIPLELRERVFERFFRIPGTTASGSGLGLAIVVQIAELHHAKIMLHSGPNNIGLQFDVIFPKS
jgi:two-component system, OmpR family, sensor histidine kinase QseC